jgi:hypothetical protein
MRHGSVPLRSICSLPIDGLVEISGEPGEWIRSVAAPVDIEIVVRILDRKAVAPEIRIDGMFDEDGAVRFEQRPQGVRQQLNGARDDELVRVIPPGMNGRGRSNRDNDADREQETTHKGIMT